jgi:hypothetical protein
MAIQLEDARTGHWVDPRYADRPGTFAMVIGVSDYRHLDGSRDPEAPKARRQYGLGQLRVSALTATKFFDWLKGKYRYDPAPLSNCWLLLSPTTEEENHGLPNAPAATFANCRTALREWYQALASMPASIAEECRAFFFFSGHGIELYEGKQILLPTDYLEPPEDLNQALSTQQIRLGMRQLRVPHVYFFLDACRNADREMRERNVLVEGQGVVSAGGSHLTYQTGIVAPLIYAAASGGSALEPADPKDGISVFGRALLEGLGGHSDLKLTCDKRECSVDVFPLWKFLEHRIPRLLKEMDKPAGAQVPRNGPDFTDGPITLVGPPRRGHGGRPPPRRVRRLYDAEHGGTEPEDGGGRVADFVRRVVLPTLIEGGRALSLLERGKTSRYDVRAVDLIDDSKVYAEVGVASSDQHWLEFNGPELQGAIAFVLPSAGPVHPPPDFVLEFSIGEIDSADGPAKLGIGTATACLAASNEGALGEVAVAWRNYQALDYESAAKCLDKLSPNELLDGSGLAFVVAGLVAIETGRFDWLDSVSEALLSALESPGPQFLAADLSVLRTEWLRRTNQDAQTFLTAVRDQIDVLERFGLPQTGRAFGYLLEQLDSVSFVAGSATVPEPDSDVSQFSLKRARSLFNSGGLFTAFAGDTGEIDPGILQAKGLKELVRFPSTLERSSP